MPPQQSIPTHAPNGEAVDVELFEQQVKDMFATLKATQLVEAVHEMRSCPYFDCLFASELAFQHYDVILPMPRAGREHRFAELSETLRYIRACGGTGDILHTLQDARHACAHGSDFVATSQGILIGYGTPRTNKQAALSLAAAVDGGGAHNHNEVDHSDQSKLFAQNMRFFAVELHTESPALAELVTFAGMRTLLVQDSAFGRHAVTQVLKHIPNIPWQVLKTEPACSVLSHLCGAHWVYDVLCDEDFPLTLERIGESGLNPFPIAWSEPRKLGISMRSVCLISLFARGSLNGGDYSNHMHRPSSEFNYHSRTSSSNARLFANGHRRHSDSGTSIEAQLRCGEIVEPVFQSPPRYAPPMHRYGQMVKRRE